MPVERSDVGTWVLKGNPTAMWAYFENRKDQGLHPGDLAPRQTWSLGPTARNELMEPGDLVALYMGGPASMLVEIGILNDEHFEGAWDPDYVIDPNDIARTREFRGYDGLILTNWIGRAQLKADPVIANSEFIRAPQMSNPTYLTPQATIALAAMIPTTDLQRAKWAKHPVIARGR